MMIKEITIDNLIKSLCHYFFINENISEVKEAFCQISDNADLFNKFKDSFFNIKQYINKDLAFFMDSDPASDNKEEIIYAYPGFKAIFLYRIAHVIYQLGLVVEARLISEKAHSFTGIDIHPGATIGSPFFIDHGTGIVIGQTTIIGNNVKIYQGVTLGALSLAKGYLLKGQKRHPTVKDNVTIYAGASILGGDVIIGSNSVIGSNVFITESIPDNTRVVNAKPELVFSKKD